MELVPPAGLVDREPPRLVNVFFAWVVFHAVPVILWKTEVAIRPPSGIEAYGIHALTSPAQLDPRWTHSCIGALFFLFSSWAIVVAIASTLAAGLC